MSPVFRHGRLRLYLLRLLDEEPRHGYEVIRMLRDRFMGVYAPSPGTIYPRLARLEEEGLVTHDEIDGRKVYRITGAGRAELRERCDELTELERELAESVSGIVREVGEDVRETVRSLREELTRAARAAWRGKEQWPGGPGEQDTRGGGGAHRQPEPEYEDPRRAFPDAREQEQRERGDARGTRERGRAGYGPEPLSWNRRDWGRGGRGSGWDERPCAPSAPGWPGWRSWQERHSGPGPDARVIHDLERIAREFTADLGRLAWQAGASVRQETLSGLRSILSDTLDRISDEVFRPAGPPAGRHGAGGSAAEAQPGTGTQPGTKE